MSKLISANLSRLFRGIWFWACGLLMLLYSFWQAFYLSESIAVKGSAIYMAACCLALAALSTGLGLMVFRRKDLK